MPHPLSQHPWPRPADPAAPDVLHQPLGFFLLENLLIARQGSMFPTNGAGFDEDVNVYLAGLLSRFLRGEPRPGVQFGAGPLLAPPTGAGRSRRADCYRLNADHRLISLGLFGWGDGLRRQAVWRGMTAAETRARDLSAGQACYAAAADLVRGRASGSPGLVEVWEKLARHFEDYVHVLGVLATRRLGLGARLEEAQMARLLPPPESAASADRRAVAALLAEPPPRAALDTLLDLWLVCQKNPEPRTRTRLQDLATWLGVRLPTA